MTLEPPRHRVELEEDIEEYCVGYTEELGWENLKLDKIEKGWPDRLFFAPNGAILIVEFKRGEEKPRPKQVAVHRRLWALDHEVHVVRRRKCFRRLVEEVLSQVTTTPE